MKKEEAISYLQQLYPNGGHCWLDEQRIEAIGMAIKALQEEPVSEGRDIFDNCLKSEEKFILPQKISGNINCENCLYSSACALGDIQACIIDKPVSEELEEASYRFACKCHPLKTECSTSSPNPEIIEAFKAGVEWQKEHLWKSTDGDDLPEIDKEVIALFDNGKVGFAHRPPEYWDGKNIVTGKVTRNYPKTYDKGGWNIPNVKYWLDCLMPKEIEL